MTLSVWVMIGLFPGVAAGSLGPMAFRWQLLRFLPALLFIAIAVLVVIYSNSWVLGGGGRPLTLMLLGTPAAVGYLIGAAAAWLMRFILSLNR